jgi:gliding motility-associated-like protein
VVTVSPLVVINSFLPASSIRCQGTGTVTYSTTAVNSTGIAYSLDAASIAGGNTIDPLTGTVTYSATWSGTTTITASAAGCGGPKIATHVVSVGSRPSATVTTANVACFGSATGSVNLTVSGGSPGYTFVWSNGAVSEDLNNVAAGNYTVTITDSKGCTATASATVTQPASAVSGTITSKTNATFGGYDGSVTIAGAGGVPPYTYRMGAGAYQTSGTFSSLGAGTYTVTVRDANLCTATVPVTITQPLSGLKGTLVSQVNVTCFGASTGSATVAGLDGILPYEYKINSGSYQASPTFTALAAGNYVITIRDAVLTEAIVNVTITQPATAVTGTVTSQTNVQCYGSKTGSFTINASGGSAPYQYKLGTGAFQSSGAFTSLGAGTYTVTIQDVFSCSSVVNVTITQPAAVLSGTIAIQNNVTCNGAANGSVTIAGTGGTPPYQYSLNGAAFQSSGSFTGLAPASYTVSIRDANMCSASVVATITQPAVLSISYTKQDATCPGDLNASITLNVTGGTEPYKAIWSDGATTLNRTGITAGTYSVVVTDKNNCAAAQDITVGYSGSGICLEIQEIITPNNDGYYDTWNIKNIELFNDAEVNVYNRWGKRVYSSKNFASDPWDGTFEGKLLPTDSYHYVIHFNNGTERKTGVVSIIR